MDLLLARHAESVPGATTLMTALTPRGETQAVALGRRLADRNVEHVRCSPLPRAARTSAVVCAALGLRPSIDARLAEIRGESVSGRPLPPPRERGAADERDAVETWSQFLTRVSLAVSDIQRSTSESGACLVITHSGVFDAVHELVTGCRMVELAVGHTALTTWRFRPGDRAGRWLMIGDDPVW